MQFEYHGPQADDAAGGAFSRLALHIVSYPASNRDHSAFDVDIKRRETECGKLIEGGNEIIQDLGIGRHKRVRGGSDSPQINRVKIGDLCGSVRERPKCARIEKTQITADRVLYMTIDIYYR